MKGLSEISRVVAIAGGIASILMFSASGPGFAARNDADPAALRLTAPAFQPNGEIPRRFTCEGDNVSPALQWTDPPAETRSLVLIADDPDAPAGTWVHWVVYDLPSAGRSLHEGVPAQDRIDGGGTQGRNDFQKVGYGGPCPPPGKPHRYFFKLYALDVKLNLQPGATKQEVERAMQGHVVARTELIGRFGR